MNLKTLQNFFAYRVPTFWAVRRGVLACGTALIMGLCCFGINRTVSAGFEVDPFLVSNDSNTINVRFAVDPGTHYQAFPVYLRVILPPNDMRAWGVQIYTDNKNPNQNNVTITTKEGYYGGFFNYPEKNKRLPVYWRVYNQVMDPGRGVPMISSDGWAGIQDKSDAALQNRWDNRDVLLARTVANYDSLAAYPQRGKEKPLNPFYLYIGADFSQAISFENYSIIFNVDLYHLGTDITAGGYATPNPFTPITGQRTNFNFFLNDISSFFTIKIYTLRGRLIRTITDQREWDGRNDSGNIVEGGVYIYQIAAEGQRVSGTVVVIK
jgi:hypothetical protein